MSFMVVDIHLNAFSIGERLEKTREDRMYVRMNTTTFDQCNLGLQGDC